MKHLKNLKEESGVVAIFIGLAMVALVGMLAYAIDTGSLYQERRTMQTAADAASLAGAQELPDNPGRAVQAALDYAAMQGIEIISSDIIIKKTYSQNDTITVTVSDPDKKTFFAGIFGINSVNVGATATAMVGSPSEFKGLVPWYLVDGDWVPGANYDLYKNKTGSVSFNGESTGGSLYRDNISYGYQGTLKIGDPIACLSGFKTGPTGQGTETRVGPNPLDSFSSLTEPLIDGGYRLKKPDTQLVVCPVVTQATASAGHGPIIGFAPILITYYASKVVVGKFLDEAMMVSNGGIEAYEGYGMKVIRLIN
jgi:Flp pilus assembly protein TadG